MIMRQPASNLFVPYMTNLTNNITSIICDTNYSLKKSFPKKIYHQHSIPYYSTFRQKLSMLFLERCLYPHFGTTRSCWKWMSEKRPGIFSGRYHHEREKISLCSLVRYIIKGSKKQRWVVWGGGTAKISHKTEGCLQQLKIFEGGKS